MISRNASNFTWVESKVVRAHSDPLCFLECRQYIWITYISEVTERNIQLYHVPLTARKLVNYPISWIYDSAVFILTQ